MVLFCPVRPIEPEYFCIWGEFGVVGGEFGLKGMGLIS